MTAEELLKSIGENPMERLRWRVLSSFGIFPASNRSKELSDEDLLVCGAHMVLDARKRSAAYMGNETERNGSFDEERFSCMSEGCYE